ncbi:MAG: DNA polymerase III subunit gamma/tau [Salinarimonadaceae bacterium]|nr:MAG: DNA polymerase III subunit gamma/tau [Salinarimonadaceae bacterium]
MNDDTPGAAPDPGHTPDEPGFAGFDAPASARADPGYRVLARKYRPRDFSDLIGQEAMVRTISNAFHAGRIPQAWMLTGVRGVGKTTTARILARGLNYSRPGWTGGPTINLAEPGEHCEAIIEGRHIDVMEIDAASNNGVDNIRQINDAVRYSPVTARYKVYIVDEVHMLSGQAFNAFLKTLEEPPPHAKFIFATTEIHKVPVTILSRCQRFDLRRVEADRLVAHLSRICALEKVESDPEALTAIARAAEGSVRDSLSLLDQAIAHGAGAVSPETVRDMLGLADRARVIDLFEAVMRGDVAASFGLLGDQYAAGADPAAVLRELAGFTHLTTRLKLAPDTAQDPSLTEVERKRGVEFAQDLPVRALSRAWQILLKGIAEVEGAARPIAAAEMVLVRLAYAADLPTPDEALRMLAERAGHAPAAPSGTAPSDSGEAPRARAVSGAGGPTLVASAAPDAPARPAPAPSAPQALRLARFEDLVALAGERRDIVMKAALERDVRLVRFEDGQLEFALAEGASRNLASDLARVLAEWTGRRWMVALSSQPGEPTLKERAEAAARDRREGAAEHPLVRSVLDAFPGARIVDVRERADAQAEPALEGYEDSGPVAPPETDDDF